MDAITLLRQDHKTVKGLFTKIDKLGNRATTQLKALADEVVKELSIHAAIEEQIFYPAVRANVPDENDTVLESLEEHHIVKWVLSEIDGMAPGDERYRAKLTVLKENVLHHAEEEESELFPAVRRAMGRKILAELGEKMAQAKKTAPTRPHPRTPDTPPLNIAAGAVAGATDRALERGKKAVQTATRAATRTRKTGPRGR